MYTNIILNYFYSLASILKVDVDIVNEYIAFNTSEIETIQEYTGLISTQWIVLQWPLCIYPHFKL